MNGVVVVVYELLLSVVAAFGFARASQACEEVLAVLRFGL